MDTFLPYAPGVRGLGLEVRVSDLAVRVGSTLYADRRPPGTATIILAESDCVVRAWHGSDGLRFMRSRGHRVDELLRLADQGVQV